MNPASVARATNQAPIVAVRDLTKRYRLRADLRAMVALGKPRFITAVDGVSFEIQPGETFGLVGQSGSGKTTIGRLLVRLEEADSGEIRIDGQDPRALKGTARKLFYRAVQMVFQDPYGSINPRFTVLETLMDPVRVQRLVPRPERRQWIARALDRSGLSPPGEYFAKYPHELSGGQRQRLAIARALVMEPRLLVADEPVSMLDVSIKAGILNLLKSLAHDDGLTVLYISHDLSTVRYLCRRIAVMYCGRFVEVGPSEDVIDRPRHPYSRALKAAIPIVNTEIKRPRVVTVSDEATEGVVGCPYRGQCPEAMDVCSEEDPALRRVGEVDVACHLY